MFLSRKTTDEHMTPTSTQQDKILAKSKWTFKKCSYIEDVGARRKHNVCQNWYKGVKQQHKTVCWIKRNQLDVTCFIISFFNAQHVSVNTSILRSLRLICWVVSWVVLLWFDVCWCYIVVWLGWCGIRNTNTHRTRAIQPMKQLNK